MSRTVRFVEHRLGRERRDEFVSRGFRPGHVFPHVLRFLPKAGPDGYKLAERMVGSVEPSELWEIVLHADGSMLAEFPSEVFFDDDVVWHQQQFGVPGQVATANVVLRGSSLWSMVHVSDLVQRIGRRRELRTRIENRFRGWHDMLLNGVLAFAVDRGVRRIHLASASLAKLNTDRKRTVQDELFDRVYDRCPRRLYALGRAGGWWTVDVAENRHRLVAPERVETARDVGRRIQVCHDLERALGHDPSQGLPEQSWDAVLRRMLEVERAAGVRATYSVVGTLLEEVRPAIAEGGHCLSFHSFDHDAERPGQLEACRRLDYRLKGYRPPRSILTGELSPERLLFHNFEWIASSERSLGLATPLLEQGLVRVPVAFDDYPLFSDRTPFDEWAARATQAVRSRDSVAFGLHDCYAFLWLDRYEAFLSAVRQLGETETVDELASRVTLAAAV